MRPVPLPGLTYTNVPAPRFTAPNINFSSKYKGFKSPIFHIYKLIRKPSGSIYF
jgi:hypothetical protein